MNIGEASRLSGVSPRMIRHYEKLELIPAPSRRTSGYREYGDGDVHRLRFIATARATGMAIDEITELLRLWSDTELSLSKIGAAVSACAAKLDLKLGQIGLVKAALLDLAASAEADRRPEHPIMPMGDG